MQPKYRGYVRPRRAEGIEVHVAEVWREVPGQPRTLVAATQMMSEGYARQWASRMVRSLAELEGSATCKTG